MNFVEVHDQKPDEDLSEKVKAGNKFPYSVRQTKIIKNEITAD